MAETNIASEVIIESKITNKSNPASQAYATGKRKTSIARVWIKPGKGNFLINKKNAVDYFKSQFLVNIINQPFNVIGQQQKFDVVSTVQGGGTSGQIGAIKHGISKALLAFDENNRTELRKNGFLTRDSRIVERKKYGLKKARKGPTYRKR